MASVFKNFLKITKLRRRLKCRGSSDRGCWDEEHWEIRERRAKSSCYCYRGESDQWPDTGRGRRRPKKVTNLYCTCVNFLGRRNFPFSLQSTVSSTVLEGKPCQIFLMIGTYIDPYRVRALCPPRLSVPHALLCQLLKIYPKQCCYSSYLTERFERYFYYVFLSS
jgi:hypothetical protein